MREVLAHLKIYLETFHKVTEKQIEEKTEEISKRFRSSSSQKTSLLLEMIRESLE